MAINEKFLLEFATQGEGAVVGAMRQIGDATDDVAENMDEASSSTRKLAKEIEKLRAKAAFEEAKLGSAEYRKELERVKKAQADLRKSFQSTVPQTRALKVEMEGAADASMEFKGATALAANAALELAGKVIGAAQSFAEFVREGDRARAVMTGFDALGGTAKDMEALKVATKGMVDDTTLQKMFNLGKGLGLANDEIVDLAKVAGGAAGRLEKDLGDVFEQIVKGAPNMSFEELKANGLPTLQSGEMLMRELAVSLGKTTDQITAQEKAQFGVNKVREAGAALAKEFGDSNAAASAQATASLDNLIGNTQVLFAEMFQASGGADALGVAFDQIFTLIQEHKPTLEAVGQVALTAMGRAFASMMPVIESLIPVVDIIMSAIQDLAPVSDAIAVIWTGSWKVAALALKAVLLPIAGAAALVGGAVQEMIGVFSEAETVTGTLAAALQEAARLAKLKAGADRDAKKAQEELNTSTTKSIGALTQVNRLLAASVDVGVVTQVKDASQAFEVLDKSLKLVSDAGADTDAQAAALLGSISALGGNVEQQSKELNTFIDGMHTSIDALEIASGVLAAHEKEQGAFITNQQRIKFLMDKAAISEAQATRLVRDGTDALRERANALEAAADAQLDATKGDGKDDPTPTGRGRGKERLALILRNQLEELTPLQQKFEQYNRELQKNVNLAGKSGEAIEASTAIFERQSEALLRGFAAQSGIGKVGEQMGAMLSAGLMKGIEEQTADFQRIVSQAVRLDEIRGETRADVLGLDEQQRALADSFAQIESARAEDLRLFADDELAKTEIHAFHNQARLEAEQELMIARSEMRAEEFAMIQSQIEGSVSEFAGLASAFVDGDFAAGGLVTTLGSLGAAASGTMSAFSQYNKLQKDVTKGTISQGQAITSAAAGGLAAGGQLAAGLIEDEQTKAGVLGAVEIAKAAAAFAIGNVAGGIAHTGAAGLFFAVAGGAFGAKKPSKKGGDKERGARQKTELTRDAGGSTSAGVRQTSIFMFSALDDRPPGAIVADALNKSARRGQGARLSSDVVGGSRHQGRL
jgi:hypothetical protein